MNYYRHGDISFHPLKELPKNLKKVEHNGMWIAAYGEVTGHKHIVKERENDSFFLYQDEKGNFILDVQKPVTITHEEHKTITIKKGFYIKEQEREYDYFELKSMKVLD